MGLIRGGLLVISLVLLFISLLLGNLFLTLSWSLNYDNVKVELASVSNEIIQKEMSVRETIVNNFKIIESYCQNNSDYVFAQEGYIFDLPCSVVLQGQDAVISHVTDTFVEEIYYKEYDCDFWDCFKKTEQPFFLVSEKAKDYWYSKFYLALMSSVVLIVLSFFLIEKRTNLPLIVGSLLIISALPFLKINWLLSLFGDIFYGLLSIFFSQAHSVFLYSLILGIFVILIGLVFKLFKVGFKISKLFSKKQNVSEDEVKEIVKEEVKKEKSKPEKTVKKKKK